MFGIGDCKQIKQLALAESLGVSHQFISNNYYNTMKKLNKTAFDFGMTKKRIKNKDISLKTMFTQY